MGAIVIVIISAAILAATALVILLLHLHKRRMQRLDEQATGFIERSKSAVWAKALVVGARGGPAGEYAEKALVNLTLEVTPPGGRPYRAFTSWLVDFPDMGFVAEGQEMSVKIDAADPKIIYPNVPWAEYIAP